MPVWALVEELVEREVQARVVPSVVLEVLLVVVAQQQVKTEQMQPVPVLLGQTELTGLPELLEVWVILSPALQHHQVQTAYRDQEAVVEELAEVVSRMVQMIGVVAVEAVEEVVLAVAVVQEVLEGGALLRFFFSITVLVEILLIVT
mgnify:FL=1